MQIGKYYFSKSRSLILLILIIGLFVGLAGVEREQNTKIRAAAADTFKFFENRSNPRLIACQGENCNIKSVNLIIESTGQNRPSAPVPAVVVSPPPITRPISQCKFYRNGVPLTFPSSAFPAVISEVAGKVGIPRSALAGLLRIESEPKFIGTDGFVYNDYDAHGSNVAYGLMQFYPPTFESIFKSFQGEMQSSFGKTAVISYIEPQRTPPPNDNVLRIYSIRDSLIAAAFHFRQDAGYPPYTYEKIANFLPKWFGGTCGYKGGGSDFCADLLRSINECGGS